MSQQSPVVLSTLHSQAARDFLSESLSAPQTHRTAAARLRAARRTHRAAGDRRGAAGAPDSIRSALAGEIMRVANSPVLRPRSPIVSLQQAVSWLGVAEVRNIAMAVMLRGEVFTAPGHEPESEELWREAWLAGLWAKEIARERRKHVESAFLAALMHRTRRGVGAEDPVGIRGTSSATVMDAAELCAIWWWNSSRRFGRLLMRQLAPARRCAGRSERMAPLSRDRAIATLPEPCIAAHLLATHTLHPQLLSEELVLGKPGVRATRMSFPTIGAACSPNANTSAAWRASDAAGRIRPHLSRFGTRRPEGRDPGSQGRLSRRHRRARAAGRRLMPAVRHHPQQGAARAGAALSTHAAAARLLWRWSCAAMRRCPRCCMESTPSSRRRTDICSRS